MADGDKPRDSWLVYVGCALLCVFNVFGVGCSEASRYAARASDASFAGMYIVIAPIIYGPASLLVSGIGAIGYSMRFSGSRKASFVLLGACFVGTIMIWTYSLTKSS